MERIITITANNGRVFKGTDYQAVLNEVNAYEAELKLQEEKEATERKTREEKSKKLAQYKEKKLKDINDTAKLFNELVNDYEKETGMKLYYSYDLTTGERVLKETPNSIDFAWDDFFGDFFRGRRRK